MVGTRLRSQRSPDDAAADGPGGAHDRVVVVGEGRLAERLAVGLGATHVPELPDDPTDLLRDAGALVALGHTADFALETTERNRRDRLVEQARRAARAVAEHGLHGVVVSSAMVCGAAPGRPVIVDDEPRDEVASTSPGVVGRIAAFERAFEAELSTAGEGDHRSTILRCAALVGPGVDTLVTRHFEAPRLLVVRDAARGWQLLHLDDLVTAVRTTLGHGLAGVLTVGPVRDDGTPDALTSDEVAELSGRRLLTLPASTAFALAESLHRVGAVPAPPDELAFAVYPWTVDPARLVAAGWRSSWSSARCVGVLVEGLRSGLTLAGRRVGARDAAALGAAGAAVALLGTAAVWRQARGHGHR
ncbi:nucleoside-diphosphate sugar epimerase [Luteimicrobium sp. DT211]|uniref:nucleoside-diphosphate sugar epimerase n=1 Tax=Luteimicrobium sp. DT211 TaxID=3393412 RepID=UPI003CEC7B38